MGMVLNAEQILGADDRKPVRVPVPEWSGDILLRPLSGADADRYEASLLVRIGDKVEVRNDNARAKLVALSAVDEAGALLFTLKQAAALGEKSGAVLDRLHTKVEEISGMGKHAVQDAEKNSEQDPGDGSASA